MNFTTPLTKVRKHDAPLAGGKGASLGELIAAGIPVPKGFVIVSNTFDAFITSTGLDTEIDAILDTVDTQKMHTVERASEKIHALIDQFDLPKTIETEIRTAFATLGSRYIAVRSSATAEDGAAAAWAGQLETYLNTTEATLLPHIKKCWASLFSPRAIFYRFQKGFHDQHVSVAVVVQTMVESEKSGIAFSVHPVTQDHNQLIIEAGLGLGEAVVSGSITPDSYVVHKDTWNISEKQIHTQERGLYRAANGGNQWQDIPAAQGTQSTLSDNEVIELAQLVAKIEKHYGFPVDVEWAKVGNQIFITQSRAITTLTPAANEPANDFKFMWGQKQSAMISEAMMWQLMNTLTTNGKFVPSHIPETLFIIKEGIFEHLMPVLSYKHITQYGERYMTKTFPALLEQMIDEHVTGFFAFADEVRKKNLHKLSNQELLTIFTRYESYFQKTFVFFGTSSNWWTDTLTDTIRSVLSKKFKDTTQIDEYFIDLCTPAEIDETIKERLAFSDLVKTKQTTPDRLEEYARQFPALFFNTYNRSEVQDFLQSRAKEEQSKDHNELQKRMLDGLTQIRKKHARIYKELRNPLLQYCATTLQKSAINRYRLKHVWSGGEYLFLDFLQELSVRIGVTFDDFIKTYTFSDIKRFLSDGITLDIKDIQQRRLCFVMHSKDGHVHLLQGEAALKQVTALLPTNQSHSGHSTAIKGQIANKGCVTGKARVVFVKDLQQFLRDSDKFEKGEILVTTMTSPVMIPLIEKASGIITDEGGICSHAAISAREFGIPCLIGTHGASSLIRTGDQITLNANTGEITLADPLHIHNHTWFLAVTRNMSFWHQCLMVQGWRHNYGNFEVPGVINCLSLTVNGTQSHCFLDADEYLRHFLLKIQRIVCHPKKLKRLEFLYSKNAKVLLQALKQCQRKLTPQTLERFFTAYCLFTPGLQITTGFGKFGTEALQKTLQEAGYPEVDIPRIIAVITYPNKHTPLSSSQRDLLQIAAKIQCKKLTNAKRTSALKAWLKQYQNIPVNYCEEPWTIRDVQAQLRDMLKKDCTTELGLLQKNHRERITEKKKVLTSIRSKKIHQLANGLATCTYLNEYRKNIFSTVSLGYRPIFTKLARKGGSKNWRDCFYCTPEELLALAKGERIAISRLKNQRQRVAILCDKNGKTEILDQQSTDGLHAYVESLHSAVKTPEKSQTEIRGFSASQGIARGTVKVVLSSKEFSKFNPGDILVTTMTSVDFVPIMEKAAAFVTNEGGVTSHASIVAREMNKPCILATKNATSLLKDGDEVEVDANAGIIKVLTNSYPQIAWTHYITRPFTLLGASLWREWYAGEWMQQTLGVTNSEALFLEVYPNVVRYYREKKQMEALQMAAKSIIQNDPQKLMGIFRRGQTLHQSAERILKLGWRSVPDFESAAKLIIEIAIHATVVPFLTLAKFDELHVQDQNLRTVAEQLRVASIYPRFFAKIVTPHAEDIVKKMGLDPKNASLLTMYELRQGNFSELKKRIQLRKKNQRFIYTFSNGREAIEWTTEKDIESRVALLENMSKERSKIIKGQSAFSGKVTGKARVILTDNPHGIIFNKGDILVSINSTPALMPLIQKCSAMVTDEGGISCHAAIVSRELQKPCVMGTKLATSIIKDGDKIEVDANTGVVRILSHQKKS